MTTIGVGSSAILILCFFHEEKWKGVADCGGVVEGLWRGCCSLLAILPSAFEQTAIGGRGDVGRGQRRGDYLKLAESLVRQQS